MSSIPLNKQKKELNIFNLNIWGVSYFDDDIPWSSINEKYNITSVRQSFVNVSISYLELGSIFAINVLTYLKFQYLNESYPNPIMIPAIQKYVTDNALIGMLNSARKKSERLNSICNHLK